MERQIFEVYAKVVDANGNYNTMTNYPKTFDSRNSPYNGDIEACLTRAKAEYYDTLGAALKVGTRQLQTVILMTADGRQIMRESYGAIAPIPDPELEGEGEGTGEPEP